MLHQLLNAFTSCFSWLLFLPASASFVLFPSTFNKLLGCVGVGGTNKSIFFLWSGLFRCKGTRISGFQFRCKVPILLRVTVLLGVVVLQLAQSTETRPDGLLVLGFGSVRLLFVLVSHRLLPSGSVRFIHAKIQMVIAFRKVPPNQRIVITSTLHSLCKKNISARLKDTCYNMYRAFVQQCKRTIRC